MVIVVAAWMLDAAACAGMALGAPRVTVSALVELHQLLIERGFRQSSLVGPTIVQEERCHPRPTPAQHGIRFGKASGDEPPERRIALARLASLLLEAADVAAGERDDDER